MKKLIPHIAIILTAMIITLVILNYLNPLMGFLSRGISKIIICLWIASIISLFIYTLSKLIKKDNYNE